MLIFAILFAGLEKKFLKLQLAFETHTNLYPAAKIEKSLVTIPKSTS